MTPIDGKAMEVQFASGGTSSKTPRFELIPYLALVYMARRFELGIANRPDGSAWNALSANFHTCPQDREFVLNRLGHVADHANKLKAILAGEMADDGDDHAGAILWGGAFAACASAALRGVRPADKEE
jgi:hypothetical protein